MFCLQMSLHHWGDSLVMVWIYRNPHNRVAWRMFQFPSRIRDRLLLAHDNVFCKRKEKQCVGYRRFLRCQCRMSDKWEYSSVSFRRTKLLPHNRHYLETSSLFLKGNATVFLLNSVWSSRSQIPSNDVNKAYLYYARHKVCAIFRSIMLSLARKMIMR